MGNNYKLNSSILALFIALILAMFQVQAVTYVAHVYGLYSSQDKNTFNIFEYSKGLKLVDSNDHPSFDIYVEYAGSKAKTEEFDKGIKKVKIPSLEGDITHYSITPDGFIEFLNGTNFPFDDKEVGWKISVIGIISASEYLKKSRVTSDPSDAEKIEFMNYHKEISGYMPLFLNKETNGYRAIMLDGIYHISKLKLCEKDCSIS